MKIRSVSQLDLSRPAEDLENPNIERPWKDEVFYFIVVDRFHDGKIRNPVSYSSSLPFSLEKNQLMKRQGGTFKGIQSQLRYIKNLGCTAIWLSPVFENYESTYHGYAITNFLATDHRLGSLEDLKSLVKEAHLLGIRVILDIVLNHTADTWLYKELDPIYNDKSYAFGQWKDATYPLPHELRSPEVYKKMGAIQNWDTYPETQEGDIFELKKLVTDESAIGQYVLDVLVKIYSYWIKETNIDGFRLDTVKHLTPYAVSYFSTKIKEYARYLNKNNFLIVGEAVGDDKLISKYLKPTKTKNGMLKGMDAALDFPLHFILEDVFKGERSVKALYQNYFSKQKLLLKWNKSFSDFYVFADNHDQIGQEYKSRIGNSFEEKETIALLGFLFFMYGVPCLYYGTEQKLEGNGPHDSFLREPMFGLNTLDCYHNEKTSLFCEIASLIQLRKSLSHFQEGEVDLDTISVNKAEFLTCLDINEVIYWSKRVFGDKLILLFNLNKAENKSIVIKFTNQNLLNNGKFEYVYNSIKSSFEELKMLDGKIKIELFPLQFVILRLEV